MAISILGVLPSIDRTFSQCFWLRDVYVFNSSHLNSGVVPSISRSLQSRQIMRGLVAVVSQTKLHEGWTILNRLLRKMMALQTAVQLQKDDRGRDPRTVESADRSIRVTRTELFRDFLNFLG